MNENNKPHFFKTPIDFRKWLTKNHQTEKELVVGFYKVNSGKQSLTWSESVDQAICFGWIDGVRRSIDEASYAIRFTPRKPTSIWSKININKVKELTEKGLMEPAGIAAFQLRKEEKSGIYSFENDALILSPDYEKIFKANKKAWNFFNAQSPYYRKQIIYRIMSAKQMGTQISRLNRTISASEKHEKWN